MEATVAERGQITLPKAVRDALGLTKGTTLKVELDGGRIILRKNVDDALSKLRGRFKLDGFTSTEDAMRAIRGHRFDAMEAKSALRAGEMQRRYRQRGGNRSRTVADFLIGAHAMMQCDALITSDAGFYRDYFKGLRIIVPAHP